jgi:hypothetical protein
MTDQQLEQRLRSWYRAEIGEAERAPAALRASVAAIPAPQRPVVRLARRFLMTQMQLRLATAAVIGVIAIGGSLYLFQRGQPAVGNPSSSPTLQSSPTPAPQSSLPAHMTFAWGATTTLLADGRVLIAGGASYQAEFMLGGVGYPEKYTYFDSARLYDPATRTFTPTGSMTTARGFHSATLLSDGRVLITGGSDTFGHSLASAELYDPGTGTFSTTGSMATTGDGGVTAVRLLDGRVLVAGGVGGPEATAWGGIYNPSSGTFSPVPSMPLGVGAMTVTLLADGRVLIAGGVVDMGVCSASAEIFDPRTDTFSPTGSMTAPRCGTATLLRDGRVLMMGGVPGVITLESSAEIFDPKTGTFSSTGSPANSWTGQTATLLTDGRVLVAGGYDDEHGLARASAELYDPATGTFSPTGSMAVARDGHTATLLADGRVLVTGGWDVLDAFLTSAEIYDPTTGTFSPAN